MNRFLWALLALALLFVAFFAVGRPWVWGTMDDTSFAQIAQRFRQTPTQSEKRAILFPDWRHSDTAGRFRPLFQPYLRGRFILWPNPTAQHGIQLLLILSTLLVWWRLAKSLEMDDPTISLGLLCTLYLGPFTVAGINFLSILELPLLLLMSGAILLGAQCRIMPSIGRAIALILLIGASLLLKETSFCFIPSVLIAWIHRDMKRWEKGIIGLFLVSFILFPLGMLLWVKGGYSASYSLGASTLLSNTIDGLKNLAWTYKFGMPFLFVGYPVHVYRRGLDRFDGVCLAGALLYFGVLVPWTSEMTYYHGPLAPFMGFLAARGAVALLDLAKGILRPLAVITVVSASVLMTASLFRQTRSIYRFNEGLKAVQDYLISHLQSESVYVTGEEASESIARGMSLRSGRTYPRFHYAKPDTQIIPPAYVVIVNGQSRYPAPTLPASAKKVMEQDRWEIQAVGVPLS